MFQSGTVKEVYFTRHYSHYLVDGDENMLRILLRVLPNLEMLRIRYFKYGNDSKNEYAALLATLLSQGDSLQFEENGWDEELSILKCHRSH